MSDVRHQRAERRLAVIARHPLVHLAAVQNLRTGKVRVVAHREVVEYGKVEAWRRARFDPRGWWALWDRTGGPRVAPLLRPRRKVS